MAIFRSLFMALFLTALTMYSSASNLRSDQSSKDGDSLLCYSLLRSHAGSLVCLGGTTTNITSKGTGRNHTAGEVFGTDCSKESEELWMVVEENGNQTFRLKIDPTQCLTLSESKLPFMAPCEPSNPGQKITLEPAGENARGYSTFVIKGGDGGTIPLKLDQSDFFCQWTWVSEIEAKAKPYREAEFTFPIEKNSVMAEQFLDAFKHALIDQMTNSTSPSYPRVRISKQTCSGCNEEECDCFPIDYDLNNFTTTTVTIDPSLNIGGQTESIKTRNLIPTGMYAKPWVPVIIELDDFDTTKIQIWARLFLHWNDMNVWSRPPEICPSQELKPGVNKIMSPYGGPLTIEVTARNPNAKPIKAKITGVPMATFTLGQTTEADWKKELQKEPRWVIYQGEHVGGLDVKRPYTMFNFSQIVLAVKRLDLMLKNSFLISGYDFNETNRTAIHAVPQGWMWWTRDPAYGAFFAGNPFICASLSDGDMVIDNDNWYIWVFGHEFGHNFDTCSYSYEYGIDVATNMYTVFQCAYFRRKCLNMIELYNDTTLPHLGKTYEELKAVSPWVPLPFLLSLLKVYGYEPLRNMHRLFRERMFGENSLCSDKMTSADRFDAVYETWSKMAGHDLTDHFDFYRVPLSDAARQRVKAEKYPLPAVNISTSLLIGDNILSWKPDGTLPSYALPPYSSFLGAQ